MTSSKVFAAMCLLLMGAIPAYAQQTKSISASVKSSQKVTVPPNGAPTASGYIQATFKHVIELTPEQEAVLNQDAAIAVQGLELGINFNLSDDPKYVPGAKSVSVRKTQTISSFELVHDIKAKWGKGSLTIQSKTNFVGLALEILKIGKAPGHPSATVEMGTSVSGNGTWSCVEFVSYELKASQTRGINPDGTQNLSGTTQAKTQGIVGAPIIY